MFSLSLSLFAEFLAYDGRDQLEFVRTRFYELFHCLVIDSRAGTVDVGEILALGEANHARTGHLITKNGMVNIHTLTPCFFTIKVFWRPSKSHS